MKKKTKNIIALSLTATLCGALATVTTFASNTEVSANTTSTFKMADGAGIRYASEEGKKEGLRFIVLTDETTKDAIVNSGKFGVIISTAEDFAGIDGDYLNKLDDMSYETNKEFSVAADNFYQNAEAYGDLYCLNVVINKGTNDTVENFTERTYSAVAYYPTGADTYAYTGNRQERSIQDVASKLYMKGDADWAKVSETYTDIGTETTPFLVENGENGEENSYQNLVVKSREENSTVANYKFEMTENVVAESTVADVIVNENDYTVTSPEGLIWDNTTACEDFVWISGDNGDKTGFEVAYENTQKFNGVGNGAVKMTINLTDTTTSNANVNFYVRSRFSQNYYKDLIEQGYTHITARFMVPNYGSGVQMGKGLNTDDGIRATLSNHIYADGTVSYGDTTVDATWFDNGMPQMDDWLEFSWLIQDGFNGLTSFPLFRINAPIAGKKFTIYLDNVYMTKSAGASTATTEVKDSGTEIDLSARNNAYNATESYTENGEAIAVVDNKVTLTNGVYDFNFRADNRYGVAKQSYVAYEEKQELWNYYTDTALNNIFSSEFYANGTTTPSTTATATLSAPDGWGTARIAHSDQGGHSDVYVKPTQNKAYYEGLKLAGYKYVTISFVFCGGQFKLAAGGTSGSDTHNAGNNYDGTTSGLVTVEKGQDGTLTETAFVGADPWNNTGKATYTVSYSIDWFINNYNADSMKILRLFTIYGNGDVMGEYNFSKIQFTKDGQV